MSERTYIIKVKTTERNYGSDKESKAISKNFDNFIHREIKGILVRRFALDDMLGDELVEAHNEEYEPEVDATDEICDIEIDITEDLRA